MRVDDKKGQDERKGQEEREEKMKRQEIIILLLVVYESMNSTRWKHKCYNPNDPGREQNRTEEKRGKEKRAKVKTDT